MWSRATSNMMSGGLTSKFGGGTQEIYSHGSSRKKSGGWWNKLKGHGKFLGKLANVAATTAGIALDKQTHGASSAAVGIAKDLAGVAGDEFNNDFLKGFGNTHVSQKSDEAYKIVTNKDLSTDQKIRQVGGLFTGAVPSSVLTSTATGSVPVGYPSTSTGTVAPTSTGKVAPTSTPKVAPTSTPKVAPSTKKRQRRRKKNKKRILASGK